jgi:hypothetical protein
MAVVVDSISITTIKQDPGQRTAWDFERGSFAFCYRSWKLLKNASLVTHWKQGAKWKMTRGKAKT